MITLISQLRLLGTTVNDDSLLGTRCPFVFTSSAADRFADELHSRLMCDLLRAIPTSDRSFIPPFLRRIAMTRPLRNKTYIVKARTSRIQLNIRRIVKIPRELCCAYPHKEDLDGPIQSPDNKFFSSLKYFCTI